MIGPDFWYLSQFLCLVTLNLAETSVATSRPSVPYEANLYLLLVVKNRKNRPSAGIVEPA